jgi:hypothetical protein
MSLAFKTTVALKNGSKVEVDVKLEWAKDFGAGDYDFDFSLWNGDQQVLDRNVREKDLDKVMLMIDGIIEDNEVRLPGAPGSEGKE